MKIKYLKLLVNYRLNGEFLGYIQPLPYYWFHFLEVLQNILDQYPKVEHNSPKALIQILKQHRANVAFQV